MSCVQWVIPTQSLANELCFTNTTTVRNLLKVVKNGSIDAQDIVLCNQQLDLARLQKTTLVAERDALKLDKQQLKLVVNDYNDQYKAINDRLQNCESAKPSRLTWFGSGVIATLVVILAGFLVTK